jgi:hypothetical protein
MSHPHTPRRVSAVALLVLIAGAARPAGAGAVADHLECYRTRDPADVSGTVDIDATHFGLSKNCHIRRARYVCDPAVKTPISISGDPLLSVYGPPESDRICYEVRCPATDPPPQEMTDQFGTHTIRLNRRSFLLCAPAVHGTEYCGDGVKNGSEACDGTDAASCPGACQADCTCPGAPTPAPCDTPAACATVVPVPTATPVPCGTAVPVTTATPVPCATSNPCGTPEPCGTPAPTCTPHSSGTFTDNCDGTVTDSATGLMWEKKTTAVGSGVNLADPHDVDNQYHWSATGTAADGTAFTDFLVKLNTIPCFAGHCDWRLPSEDGQNGAGAKELESILLAPFPCGTSPCIDPIFGPTAADAYGYWSATTDAALPSLAWLVDFGNGYAFNRLKDGNGYVRAVRTGS